MRRIVLVGGGGHCISCIEAIESTKEWDIIGIVDNVERIGETVLGYKIIGSDNDLKSLVKRCNAAIITVGQIKSVKIRQQLYLKLIDAGFKLPTIVASTARVSHYTELGDGTIVLHNVFINANVHIGVNCIINTGAIVEHDTTIGSHCHISTGVITNGGCHIGEGCFLGSGAVLCNGVTVGDSIILGAGSIVVSDLIESGTYVGCPARKIG